MSKWVLLGIRSGTKTTRYPSYTESAAGISPGRPKDTLMADEIARGVVRDVCPTGALDAKNDRIAVDYRRCVSCRRCDRGAAAPLDWEESWEWASLSGPNRTRRAYWRGLFPNPCTFASWMPGLVELV
ncbi:MAG: hypothetical protein ACPL7J_02540 [Desulfomonilaceae bacterium]